MAQITGALNEKIFSIAKWGGLNEHPDGDTRLKMGEASKMINWRITRDGNLKRRPGTRLVSTVKTSQGTAKKPVRGMWTGYVNGKEVFLVACDGKLWSLYDEDTDTISPGGTDISSVFATVPTPGTFTMFPFDEKVYILNGENYYEYNGETLTPVEGYVPLVAITISPVVAGDASESGETTGEYVNRLNGKRRIWLSPDGERNIFQLPEKGTDQAPLELLWVHVPGTNDEPQGLQWQFNGTAGQISITKTADSTPPDRGVNSIEVAYQVPSSQVLRSQVTGNLFAELFSGTTDTRVFIYGDGTNRALYTGMDYDGMPRADYFPDQYEVHVGDSNTPITGMTRHYSALITNKTNEVWALQHGIVELATDSLTPAIYAQPVNRDIGNVAPGMVRLVNNNPITAFGHALYQWSNSSYYTSNLSRDERQAKRISDRVETTLASFDLEKAYYFDDNDHQEYYVCYDGRAVVLNYATNTWYEYDNFDVACMCSFRGDLYIGTTDGQVLLLTDEEAGDQGEPIVAEWESGAMDFGADYMRKYAAMLWVGLKPATGTSVDVCVETDRKNTFRDKIVSSEKAKISGQPFMVKTKIKAKKFVYYRLLLEQSDLALPVTVTNIDFRVRQTGYAK